MSQILTIVIQTGEKTRQIDLAEPADKVIISFDNDREVVVTPTGTQAGDWYVIDIGGDGGNSVSSADNGSTVQNVRSGRNSYVAGRDGYFSR